MGIARKLSLTMIVVAVLVGVGAASASAETLSSWWHVSPTSRPTNLWTAKPEVQEVNAGALTELKLYGKFVACVGGFSFACPTYTGHPATTSATELQEQLEAAYALPSGVEVSEPSSGSYVIKTPGHFVPAPEAIAPVAGAGGSVIVQGGSGRLAVYVMNLGDAPASGCTKVAAGTGKYTGSGCNTGELGTGEYEATPIKVVDRIPAGLTALHVTTVAGAEAHLGSPDCEIEEGGVVACSFSGLLPPYESIEMEVEVAVKSSSLREGSESGTVTVTGGGAPPVNVPQTVRLNEAPTQFGVESYGLQAEEPGGTPDTRAGSHPFQLTTTVDLTNGPESGHVNREERRVVEQPGLPRNFRFELPAGVVGNANVVAQCAESVFTHPGPDREGNDREGFINACPPDTAIGAAVVTIIEPVNLGLLTLAVPLFNLVPSAGEPARFGFTVAAVPVVLNTGVRTGEGYGVTVSVDNTSESAALLASTVTFWGVPGLRAHDSARGWGCVYFAQPGGCSRPEDLSERPFLRLPTSCGVELAAPLQLEPWNQPLGQDIVGETASLGALDSCNHVPFEPTIESAPDVKQASSPSGLTVNLGLPQNENAEGLAESDMRDATVTLPEGVELNPSDADGLEACPLLTGKATGQEAQEEHGEISGIDLETKQPANCPSASKIGTVKVHSPLLPVSQSFEGSIYLATPAPNGEPGLNPFNSLLAMYIVAEDKEAGVLVKVPVKVLPNPVTGQLTAYSTDIPQLPFSDLELHFFGGGRSPLSTPPRCGTYTTSASFQAWAGGEPVVSESPFEITSGPGGAGCTASLPFAPSLTAGTTSIQAGGLSPFTMTMSREDGQQNLQAITLKMPPGLSGLLSKVKLCGEAQANAGTCGPASQIGETTVSVGLGNEPYTVTGGRVYITGPYRGAPFGLSIVNPANAGPFHLGNVIVRAKIEVNPTTAELTISSDNEGPYKIPPIIDGIPLEIKHVNVTINGVGGNNKFTFNPTSCAPMAITGSLHSTEGATSNLNVPFQVTNCKNLEFTPKFSVFTSGKTSKADGASLTATVSEPAGSLGTQANISRVKVELPKQLPSRLTTLQKACTAAQFEANPAGCPSPSVIGHAKVVTPLVPVPLEGPVYFVSHGGEAFPSLEIVLQGYGVEIVLVGATFISKSGITSTTFKTVPDQPFSTFEINLPEKQYSALGANQNLCTPTKTVTVKKKIKVKVHGRKKTVTRSVKEAQPATLQMPTEFVAQNGAVIHQSTPISVTGCARVVRHERKKKHTKKKKK